MKRIQFISVDTLVNAIYSRTFIEAMIFSLLLLLIRAMLPLILISLMLPYPDCETNMLLGCRLTSIIYFLFFSFLFIPFFDGPAIFLYIFLRFKKTHIIKKIALTLCWGFLMAVLTFVAIFLVLNIVWKFQIPVPSEGSL